MLFAVAAYTILRLGVLLSAEVPSVVPDEPGYWATARWLSGTRPLIHMNDMPVYQLVYGAFLAPLYRLPLSSTGRYRAGLVVGFLLVGAAAALLRRTVRLVTRNELLAATAFGVTLLYPATLATTSFTWSESSVLLWVALFVTGLVELAYTRPKPLMVTGLSIVVGLAPFVHGRLIFLVVVWLGVLLCSCIRYSNDDSTGTPWLLGLAAATVTLGAVGAGAWVQHLATEAIWSGGYSAAGSVRTVLSSPSRWVDIASAAAGQLRYATVSSAGLAVVGITGLSTALRRHIDPARRLVAAGVLAAMAGVFTVSAVFMATAVGRASTEPLGRLSNVRWDYTFYGRYIDPLVLAAAIAGVVSLGQMAPKTARRRLIAAGALGVSLGVALLIRWAGTALDAPVPVNIAGVAAMHLGASRIPVLGATVMALVAMGLFAWRVSEGTRAISHAVLAVVSIGALGATSAAANFHREYDYASIYDQVPEPIPAHRVALIAADAAQDRTLLLNWFGQQYVLTDSGWDFEFSDLGSEELARSPGRDTGLLALSNQQQPTDPSGSWEVVGGGGDVSLWARRSD